MSNRDSTRHVFHNRMMACILDRHTKIHHYPRASITCRVGYSTVTDPYKERIRMKRTVIAAIVATLVALACVVTAAQQHRHEGYTDTPMLPGGKWHVHDPDRPLPPVIDPGTASTEDAPGRPPSDAVVLFDGKNLNQWEHKGGREVTWTVENGVFHRPVRQSRWRRHLHQAGVRRLPVACGVLRADSGKGVGPGAR